MVINFSKRSLTFTEGVPYHEQIHKTFCTHLCEWSFIILGNVIRLKKERRKKRPKKKLFRSSYLSLFRNKTKLMIQNFPISFDGLCDLYKYTVHSYTLSCGHHLITNKKKPNNSTRTKQCLQKTFLIHSAFMTIEYFRFVELNTHSYTHLCVINFRRFITRVWFIVWDKSPVTLSRLEVNVARWRSWNILKTKVFCFLSQVTVTFSRNLEWVRIG